MLSIKYNDKHNPWYTWHVGGDSPAEDRIKDIEYIVADGHELDHIYKMFDPAIPIPKGPVVKFYGDIAKMIAGNLTNIPYEY